MSQPGPAENRSAGVPSPAGTLASAGIGFLLASVGVLLIRGRLAWPVYALWGAGGAALVAAAVLGRREVLAALRARGVRSGANTALVVMLALGIAVLVNYLAVRHHKRWDFTRTRAHTLSPQSLKLLRGLQQQVEIVAFYSEEKDPGGYQSMRDLLQEYDYASRRVDARVVDPDTSPGLARQYNVTSYFITVVSSGDRKEELSFADEQDITGAVLRLTRSRRERVYLVQGNGEHDLEGQELDGYGNIKQALNALSYDVQRLWLTQQGVVPDDCDVLVIAGPRRRYDSRELTAVNQYLERGGKALIMVDPAPEGEPLAELLEPRGLKPLAGIVVEPKWNFLGDASSVTVADFEPSDITRPFARGARSFVAVFVLARAFEHEDAPPGVEVRDLVRTSLDSWLERDFRGQIRRNSGEKRGPFTIAATVTGSPEPEPGNEPRPRRAGRASSAQSRLVVFGDSDFAANGLIANGINKDLFVNAVGWLAQAGERISVQPKEPEQAFMLLTPAQWRVVFALSLIIMPLAAIVAGAVVWWRRR
jgi:hypothetical protein